MICIYANEQWDEKGSGIENFASSLGLAYIARERHQGNLPPTFTWKNTERIIDFMLGSEEVINNVTAYGMAPLSMGKLIGDHKVQFVDLNVKQLLNMNPHDYSTPSSRRLKSPDPKCVGKYLEQLKTHFVTHKVYERSEKLMKSLEDKTEISG